MTHLKQSVSLCALAMGLGVAAMPAMAQQVAGAPDQTAAPDVSQAKIAAAQAAVAGTADAEKADVNDVVVTGTHLGRPNIGSPSPILTITSEEIKESGAISVSDVLNRLPQVAPDNQATYQDSNGAQQVQLRGLGFNRTLTLLDGQRLATSEGVNVNSIPVALIDRIDVLTGGAASVYGADAVAGVINFVLKKDYTGLQLNGSYSLFTHNNDGNNLGATTAAAQGIGVPHGQTADGGTANLNATWGGHFFDDKLKIQVFGSYIHTNPVTVSDRDYSTCYLTQKVNGLANPPTCLTSTTSTGYGVFRPGVGPNAGTAYAIAKDGSQTFVLRDGSYTYQPYAYDYLQREFTRYNGGAFVNLDITSSISAHANYLFSQDNSAGQFGPPRLFNAPDYGFANSYTINCNNPLLSAQQRGVLCGAAAGTPATVPLGIRYRFDTLPGVVEQYRNRDQRVSAGVSGKFFNDAVKADLNFVYSQGNTLQLGAAADSTPSYDHIEQSLNVVTVNGVATCASGTPGCVPLNVFTTGGGSPALINWLFGTTQGRQLNSANLYDYTANVSVDFGKFGIRSPFAKDGIAIAFGGEYRIDREINTVDAAFIDEEYNTSNFELSQNVKEAYIEASLPIFQDKRFADALTFNGSFRASKYSPNPQVFTTWQLGGVYAPVSDLSFRVSYNKASRQPTVYEYGSGISQFGGGSSDPCAGANPVAADKFATQQACQASGVSAAQYGNVTQCDNNSCLAKSFGTHPDPETAHTLTYGIVVKPRFVPGLVFSVDRFDITVDDQIGLYYDSDYMNGCLQFQTPFYCSKIHRNADGSLTSADLYRPGTTPATGFVYYGNTNQYKYMSRGYDFQGQYTVAIVPLHGSMNFIFNGTLTELRGGQDGPTDPVRNGAGYFGPNAGIPRPRWDHTLRSTYTTDDKAASLSLNWRYIGGTTATQNSGDPAIGGIPGSAPLTSFNKIPAYNLFDLNATVHIDKRFALTILANNLFDKLPPIQPDSYDQYLSRANTIPQTYDALGRFIQVSVTANF